MFVLLAGTTKKYKNIMNENAKGKKENEKSAKKTRVENMSNEEENRKEDVNYCRECGRPISSDLMYCQQCVDKEKKEDYWGVNE